MRTRARGADLPRRASLLSIAGASLLLACSGGDGGGTEPPSNSVASVDIAPSSASLTEGDTLRLSASPRGVSGAVVSGRAPTWSSNATAIATVSSSGLVTAVASGSATISASVDGKVGSAAITVTKPQPLELEVSSARSDSIGPAGGTITAAANGVTYRLTIPANALTTRQRITVTPVKAIRTLPLTGGVLGSVDLQPQGLRFAVPALLKIVASTTPPNGKKLIGFSFEGQGESPAPAVSADSGSSVTVFLNHFSGGGAGFGTLLEISSFMTNSIQSGSQPYINQFLLANGTLNPPPDFPAVLQILRNWINNLVIPEVQNAQNDFGLILAVSDWNLVMTAGLPLGISATSALLPERDAVGAALAPKLRAAIAGNNQLCASDRDLTPARNALYWQTVAADFGVDTPTEQLDRRTVLDNLCLQVMITQADFPNPGTAGQAGTLDVRAGLKFGTDPNLDLQPFNWTVTVTGSASDGSATGLADATGAFHRTITPTGNSALTILITVCLQNNAVPYLDVCGSTTIVRPFGILVNGDVTVLTQTGLQSLSNVSKIGRDLIIDGSGQGDPITSTDLKELSGLTEVGRNLTISGAGSVRALAGLKNLKKIGGVLTLLMDQNLTDMGGLTSLTELGGIALLTDAALTTLVRPPGVTTLNNGGLTIRELAALTGASGFSGLASIKNLALMDTPRLTSLSFLHGVSITGSFSILRMNGLTTLSDVTGVGAVLDGVQVNENAALQDIAAFSNLVVTVSFEAFDDPALTNMGDLSKLGTVAGQVFISGPGITSINLPTLSTAGSLRVDLNDSPNLTTVSLGALTQITGSSNGIQITGAQATCGPNRVINVQLPLLATTSSISVGISANPSLPVCAIDVSAPQLQATSAIAGAQFAAGVRSVILGAHLSTFQLTFNGTSVTSLKVPSLTAQFLSISQNLSLSGLTGGTGSVTNTISIHGNPQLSTQTATAFANSFSPHGSILISGNKIP